MSWSSPAGLMSVELHLRKQLADRWSPKGPMMTEGSKSIVVTTVVGEVLMTRCCIAEDPIGYLEVARSSMNSWGLP